MQAIHGGDAASDMDRIYRLQRHIYDASRKFYLLGRDDMLEGARRAPRRHHPGSGLRHGPQSHPRGAALSAREALRLRRFAGHAGDGGGIHRQGGL